MDYKEKYEQALEALRSLFAEQAIKHCDKVNIKDITNIFPELKESEDEKIRKEIIDCAKAMKADKWIAWLEKQGEKGTNGNEREIPNSSWSEEDVEMINHIIRDLREFRDCETDEVLISDYEDEINWLKSLKDRYTWKPSDEQMKILNEVLNFAANHENPHWNDYIFGTLHNLIIQLKKLREE